MHVQALLYTTRTVLPYVTEFRKRGHFAQKLKIELLVPRYSSLP